MKARNRKSNWPALLDLFLLEKRDLKFDWATNNCAFFVSDWIAILTGIDVASSFRLRVMDKSSASKELAEHGGLIEIANRTFAAHGWFEIPVLQAQRGDVCVGLTQEGNALGVCLGSQVAFVAPRGYSTLPLRSCSRAWKII